MVIVVSPTANEKQNQTIFFNNRSASPSMFLTVARSGSRRNLTGLQFQEDFVAIATITNW